VGFVTFHTRAGAEAAKQDLQVISLSSQVTRGKAGGKETVETSPRESQG